MTALSEQMASHIRARGGWIGFDDFMDKALYTPGTGYYAGGSADPFGERGDFVTAPTLGPLFGETLARWSAPLVSAVPAVREFGGGRGELCASFLKAYKGVDYELIEVSAVLIEMQKERVKGAGSVRWSDRLAPGFRGLVLANEVLDAMPVKCLEWQGNDQVLEWGVRADGDHFVWAPREAQKDLRAEVCRRAHRARDRGLPWSAGYRLEISPWHGPWMRSLAKTLDSGAVLLIDYGFAESELDHPGRTAGTLCAHYQHQRVDDASELLKRVGLQDLTTHVNFSALAREARTCGFDVLGFTSQANFLLNGGALELAKEQLAQMTDSRDRIAFTRSLQTLMAESDMGEVFKVILLAKNLAPAVCEDLVRNGFSQGDRIDQLAV